MYVRPSVPTYVRAQDRSIEVKYITESKGLKKQAFAPLSLQIIRQYNRTLVRPFVV
jgi:hypothetical protein